MNSMYEKRNRAPDLNKPDNGLTSIRLVTNVSYMVRKKGLNTEKHKDCSVYLCGYTVPSVVNTKTIIEVI